MTPELLLVAFFFFFFFFTKDPRESARLSVLIGRLKKQSKSFIKVKTSSLSTADTRWNIEHFFGLGNSSVHKRLFWTHLIMTDTWSVLILCSQSDAANSRPETTCVMGLDILTIGCVILLFFQHLSCCCCQDLFLGGLWGVHVKGFVEPRVANVSLCG